MVLALQVIFTRIVLTLQVTFTRIVPMSCNIFPIDVQIATFWVTL